jgi:polygalacturonase
MVRLTALSFLLSLAPVFAQTAPALQDGIFSGAEKPSSCTDGKLFFQTNLSLDSAFFICNSGAWSQIDPISQKIFVVQSFGAKGDGTADDQRAIQNAAGAASTLEATR